MKIRNQQDVEALRAALNRCRRSVWLVTPSGEQVDLKSDRELHRGIDLLSESDADSMELFASNYADEMVMMDYYSRHIA